MQKSSTVKKSEQSKLKTFCQQNFILQSLSSFQLFTIVLIQFKELFAVEVLRFQRLSWYLINNVKDMAAKYSSILRTPCSPSIFRTLVYSKPWYIQNQRHMQNPGIFRTEVYSELWDTQNSTQTKNPVKHSTREHCAKVVNNYSCFTNYNYFCNISFSRSLLF